MPIRDRRLARHLGIVLVLKVTALFGLWYFFFAPEHRVAVDADLMDRHFFPTAPATPTPPPEHGHDGT